MQRRGGARAEGACSISSAVRESLSDRRYWSRGRGVGSQRAGGTFAHGVESSKAGIGRRCPKGTMEVPRQFQGPLRGRGGAVGRSKQSSDAIWPVQGATVGARARMGALKAVRSGQGLG